MKTILLPGLICSDEVWAAQTANLPDTLAFSGYGAENSLQGMARSVLKGAPSEFYIAGHSMGARVALEICRLAPERVKKLALLNTGVHGLKKGEPEKRYALLELGQKAGMGALVDTWLPPMIAPKNRKNLELMTRLRTMCLEKGIETFEAHITALINRPSLDGFLETLNIPTLVATGELDQWSPPEQHRMIAARLPVSKLKLFEGAGHMAPAETPELVSQALKEFISSGKRA